MTKDKLSYKLMKIIKSSLAAVAVPIFIIYIMVAKPDYTIMNGLAHVVLPVAHVIGSVITWPVRVIGQGAHWIKETSNLRTENEELRIRLDAALANKNSCDIAVLENQKLERGKVSCALSVTPACLTPNHKRKRRMTAIQPIYIQTSQQ